MERTKQKIESKTNQKLKQKQKMSVNKQSNSTTKNLRSQSKQY